MAGAAADSWIAKDHSMGDRSGIAYRGRWSRSFDSDWGLAAKPDPVPRRLVKCALAQFRDTGLYQAGKQLLGERCIDGELQ